MTSTPSHSTTSQPQRRDDPLPAYRCLLAVAICADGCLVLSASVGFDRLVPSGTVPIIDASAAALLIAATTRLMLVLPRARIFRRRPASGVAVLLATGAAALWRSVALQDPVDALLREGRIAAIVPGAGLFVLATACTTLAVTATVDAWGAHRREIRWEEFA